MQRLYCTISYLIKLFFWFESLFNSDSQFVYNVLYIVILHVTKVFLKGVCHGSHEYKAGFGRMKADLVN